MSNQGQYEGVLTSIQSKSGNTKGRDWTAYSMKVADNSGSETIFRLGFDKPNLQEGSYVKFSAKPSNSPGIFQVVGDVQVDKSGHSPRVNPAAKAEAVHAAVDSRQDSIVRQNATSTAANVLAGMITAGAVVLPKAKGKAFDVYLEYLDVLTNRIFLANRNPLSAEELIASGKVLVDEDTPGQESPVDADVWGDDE